MSLEIDVRRLDLFNEMATEGSATVAEATASTEVVEGFRQAKVWGGAR